LKKKLGIWSTIGLALAALLITFSGNGSAVLEQLPWNHDSAINQYFRSGQWRADMRTVEAMVEYIIEP
jgi:hypothetical protein